MSDMIKLVRLSHVHYGHTDIGSGSKFAQFMKDFGMVEVHRDDHRVYFRGYGTAPYVYVAEKTTTPTFFGGTFVVSSREDLVKASKLGGEEIQKVQAQGGGESVSLTDPFGQKVHLIYGQQLASPLPHPSLPKDANFPTTKPRKGEFHRPQPGPAMVHKLGHFGLLVEDYAIAEKWYTSTFNLKASDVLTDNGKNVGAFFHLDLENEWVDHHTFFILEAGETRVHHSSFEVLDFDTQFLGHAHLEKAGYELAWGIGRHILGSQIFDYWFQPTDPFMVEHYADGDLVNQDMKTSYHTHGDESLYIWGPPPRPLFLAAKPERLHPEQSSQPEAVA